MCVSLDAYEFLALPSAVIQLISDFTSQLRRDVSPHAVVSCFVTVTSFVINRILTLDCPRLHFIARGMNTHKIMKITGF